MFPIIQLCHDFAHDTTAELSRHVQNYDLIWPVLLQQEQHYLNKIWIMNS